MAAISNDSWGRSPKRFNALEGTTFSNPEQRGSYPSEKKAALTLTEFEKWFATLVVEVYHQRNHSVLGMSPLRWYELARKPHRPAPDLHRLRLDFLPYAERSVQRYGISLDGIQYYSDVLRRWIGDNSGENVGKRRFIVRRDPRDISVVFFFDPELNCYFEIPYRDTSRPPLTLWELHEVCRRLAASGERNINEDLIFQAYRRMQTIQEGAVDATHKARRQKFRPPAPPVEKAAAASSAPGPLAEDFGEILPSDEIELW